MGFSRQKHWSGYPFPSPGDLPDPGIEPTSPHWQVNSLPLSHHWEARIRDDIKHNSDFQDIPGRKVVLKRALDVLICLALDEVWALLMAVFMSKFVLLGLNIPLHPFPSLLETTTLGDISNSQMTLVKIILAETLQITHRV